MKIKLIDLFVKELDYLNNNFYDSFMDYEFRLVGKMYLSKQDFLCELIQKYAQEIEPDDKADDEYWKEKLVLDKIINNELVITLEDVS